MLQITEVAPQVKLVETGYEQSGWALDAFKSRCCIGTESESTHIFNLTYKIERLEKHQAEKKKHSPY